MEGDTNAVGVSPLNVKGWQRWCQGWAALPSRVGGVAPRVTAFIKGGTNAVTEGWCQLWGECEGQLEPARRMLLP